MPAFELNQHFAHHNVFRDENSNFEMSVENFCIYALSASESIQSIPSGMGELGRYANG